MALNDATGKAFHAFAERISGTLTTLTPCAGFSTATNSAVTICSKVTTVHVATAASAGQAGAKRAAHAQPLRIVVVQAGPMCDTNAR